MYGIMALFAVWGRPHRQDEWREGLWHVFHVWTCQEFHNM
jgi:hypothetical protein